MRVLTGVILFLFSFSATAQSVVGGSSQTPFQYYLTLFSQSNGQLAPSFAALEDFKEKLAKKAGAGKNDKAFLHHLFNKTHSRFLHQFEEYAPFSSLLTEGKYNCLTATSLFSLLLTHFNFDYQVYETNYHIFILVNTSKGLVLLETTDFINGFIDSPSSIQKKMEYYKSMRVEPKQVTRHYFEYSSNVLDTVNLNGLLGLLHFNHAVQAYNEKNYKHAIAHLHHAYLLHKGKRLGEFKTILLLTVQHSNLPIQQKEKYIQKINNIGSTSYKIKIG